MIATTLTVQEIALWSGLPLLIGLFAGSFPMWLRLQEMQKAMLKWRDLAVQAIDAFAASKKREQEFLRDVEARLAEIAEQVERA